MPPVANDNPRGFWEPEDVARLHDEMLAAADSSWDDFLPMPERWHEVSGVRAQVPQMLRLLGEEFLDSTLFVLKDPRICRMVPMWNDLLQQFGAAPRFVIALRNPLEVAGSLQARNGFPIHKSLALWLRYVLDAESATRGQLRAIVSYRDLLRDWRSVTDRIGVELKISWPRSQYRAALEIEEFLSSKDRHHDVSDEEFERNSAPSPWVKKAYWALRRMSEGAVDEGMAALDAVRGELAVVERAYGDIFADYRRSLRGAQQELDQARSHEQGLRSAADDLQRRIDESHGRCQQLQGRVDQLQGKLNETRGQAAELEQLKLHVAQYREARAAELKAAQQACAAKTAEVERLRQDLTTAQDRAAEQRDELANCRSKLAEVCAQSDTFRCKLASREAALEELRQRADALRRTQAESEEQSQRRLAAREEEWRRTQAERDDELHRVLAACEDDLRKTTAESAAFKERLRSQEQQLTARERDVTKLQQDLAAREKELAAERSQLAISEQERVRGEQSLSRWTGIALSLRESSTMLAASLAQVSEAHSVRGLARRAYRQLTSRTRLFLGRRNADDRRKRLLDSGLFDVSYYLLHNPDVLGAGVDPVSHFLVAGGKERRSPCALFDTEYYLRANPDVAASGFNPLEHYLLCGAAEGRKPCALFDTAYYLWKYPTVRETGQNPLSHFLSRGAEEGCNPHPLFDTAYYLRENPEVHALRINPLVHFLEQGAEKGRKPNPLFDSAYYLRENPDVAAARTNPLQHYLEFGAAQGRNPNPFFDTAFYRYGNRDVDATGINPLQHYLERGAREGRRPSPLFDPATYLRENQDVAASGINPLEHYLECGAKEGRRPVAATPTDAAESVAFPCVDSPAASVIVPVHDRWSSTLRCLRSIQWNTGDVPYEVILADDGSTDATAQGQAAVKNLTTVAYHAAPGQPERVGLVEICNRAAQQARGKYLVFLSPEATTQAGWLKEMVDLAERDPAAGIIGPKLLSPDGLLKEAGRIVWNDASETRYGAGDDPHRPEYSHVRQSDYVSRAAMLVRRSLFEQVGGFDQRFGPQGYEDADLAFRCREQGLKVVYQPKAVVIHREPENANDPLLVTHRLDFEQKWSSVLKQEHLPPGAHLFLARDHSRPAQHLLYCDWDVPDADRDSGSFRAVNLMQILIDMGYRLSFLPANLYPAEPQVDRLRQMGIFAGCGPGFNSLEKFFAQYGEYFDAVVVSRVNVAEACMELVRKYCRKAYRVFDTTDLHFLREQREAELAGDETLRTKAAATRKKELGFIRQSDVTLVVSHVEKELLRVETPQDRVEIVSNIHPVHGSARPFAERKDMLFIGGFNHRPNPDAVKWLAKEIFPRIRQRLPGVQMYVIGSHPPVDVLALNSEDFRVLGYVPDVEPYFNECRLSVVPLRYGAGVKGKINMSMSYGVPVVSTSVGCEGMFLNDGQDVLIADEAEAFADAVCRLYTNEALWNQLSAGGLKNVEQYFSFEAARQALGDILCNPACRTLAKAA
jgi:GT2 family glycosyltransferase